MRRTWLWFLILTLGAGLTACPANDDDDATSDDDDATANDDDATANDDDATADDDDATADDDDVANDDDSGHGDDDDSGHGDDDDSGHGDDDDDSGHGDDDDDDATADDDDATSDDDDATGDDDDSAGAASAYSWGGSGDDVGAAVAVMPSGANIVVGSFSGSVDFGGGPLVSAGGTDIFVVRQSPQGAHEWSARFGGSDDDEALSVAVDAGSGDVYVGGSFRGSVDFGGGPLASAGASDAFLAKFAGATGAHTWSNRFGDTGDDSVGGIGVDSFGNPIFAGTFEGTFDAGGFTPASAGDSDIFLVRFDPSGTQFWTQSFGGPMADTLEDLVVTTAGDCYVVGTFSDTAVFDPTNSATSAGGTDAFVMYVNPFSVFQWVQTYGGSDDDEALAVGLSSTGSLLVGGAFRGTVDFGSGPVASAGGADAFLLQLSTAGVVSATTTFGAGGDDVIVSVIGDGPEALVGGSSDSSGLNLGDGAHPAEGGQDIFFGWFDTAGVIVSSDTYGGTGDDVLMDIGAGATNVGTGSFTGTTDLEGPLTSAGGTDIFLLPLF
ncbi:MAG: hypothetical protein KDA24_17205 [Deltaproteobacteria bacterium]|nr:hypothetical protein [Deltaproteobacteria bacterium]